MEKHFVVTAYIIAKIGNQFNILLHKHGKLKIWIGIGGHLETGENPEEGLIREIKEETGLSVRLLSSGKKIQTPSVKRLITPLAIYEEKVPLYQDQKAHFHIDMKYLALTKTPQKVKMKEEFIWLSQNDLKKFKLDQDVKYDVENALEWVLTEAVKL